MMLFFAAMPTFVSADGGIADAGADLDVASFMPDQSAQAIAFARDEDKHTVNPNQGTYNYDFGTARSPVREGWVAITNKAQGDIYWTGETRLLRAVAVPPREGINKINTDYVTSKEPVTFNHKIANGKYRVVINMGDARRGKDQMGVRAEGKLISDSIDADRREFVYVSTEGGSESPAHFDVEVEDGELTIDFFDNGGRDKYWVATRLSISRL
ncbi:MAG: hypothetical protein KTR15_15545 [Phycisphaeraceae bacterium]|nr:hypothetical protein [Phycisphaeraceae bacterium]